MTQKRILYYTLSILLLLVQQACTKTQPNVKPGELTTYNNITNSSARVVLAPGYDLMVDTTKLTNFLPFNAALFQVPPVGTPYFPTTGKTTNSFFIPQEFIDSKGQATVKLYYPGLTVGVADSFVVQDNYFQPNDYYIPTAANGTLNTFVVPRPQQTLTDPTHIRVRLLNLGFGGSATLTLAYADGAPVSTTTSHIGIDNWSDYTEIAYGAYAFRVLQDSVFGLQLHAKPPADQLYTIESATDFAIGGGQYYTPTITFQPGGVYTIAVSNNGGFQFEQAPIGLNSFSVITDNAPTANMQYARVQAINASEAGGMSLQVDGGTPVAVTYGAATDYHVLTNGSHDISIKDGSGNLLAAQTISLSGGDNISLWTYADSSGKTSIIPVSNNMGGVEQYGTNSDGSDPSGMIWDPLGSNMIAQTRFLNLCPDIPYATFTNANGIVYSDTRFSVALAAQNLPAGRPADPVTIPYPYINLVASSYNTIEAYQSQPNVVPGNRLINIAPLPPTAFTVLPIAYYPQGAPSIEPGVYTVALIGRNNGTQNPRLIVIKHNR